MPLISPCIVFLDNWSYELISWISSVLIWFRMYFKMKIPCVRILWFLAISHVLQGVYLNWHPVFKILNWVLKVYEENSCLFELLHLTMVNLVSIRSKSFILLWIWVLDYGLRWPETLEYVYTEMSFRFNNDFGGSTDSSMWVNNNRGVASCYFNTNRVFSHRMWSISDEWRCCT